MTSGLHRKSLGNTIFILFLGSIVGTALGRLIAWLLPDGSVVEKFFLISFKWGFEPFKVDAGLFDFTFGLHFEINVIGILGIAFAAYLLKYYL